MQKNNYTITSSEMNLPKIEVKILKNKLELIYEGKRYISEIN